MVHVSDVSQLLQVPSPQYSVLPQSLEQLFESSPVSQVPFQQFSVPDVVPEVVSVPDVVPEVVSVPDVVPEVSLLLSSCLQSSNFFSA